MRTDINPEAPPPEPAFDIASIVKPEYILKPGVYFDLDEDKYHASFGLSYSGIKSLRVSPYNWWVFSILNPRRAQVLAQEESVAMTMGKAFDARIVSGKEFFYRRYAPAISHSDDQYKDSLRTTEDMRGWLEARGLPKSGRTKDDLVSRIIACDPRVRIWDVIEEGYRQIHAGKELLAWDLIEKIEIAARMIESHPELGKAFTGGAPQVSVVWNCEKTGVLCKARFDYLKARVMVDLKTLQPRDDQPLENQIGKEIGYRKYYIQSAHYLEAASYIPGFIKSGEVYGDAPAGLLDALVKHPAKEWLWIFQLKGPAPVAKGRLLRAESHILQLGQIECDNGKHLFRACLDKYGAEPWLDPEPIRAMDENDIPAWSLL